MNPDRTDDSRKPMIGWIGVGKMGAPMATHLVEAGENVMISDPSARNCVPLTRLGATKAAGLSDFASASMVFMTLPNDQALNSVINGTPDAPGLAQIMQPGSAVIEMSTVSPRCSARIAQTLSTANIAYVRAPISGSTAMAVASTLTVLASGDEAAWTQVLPLIQKFSSKQFYLGAGDQARFMKLVLNTLVGATSALLAEALILGEKGGMTRKAMLEVINQSAVASPLIGYKVEAIESYDFTPAFTVDQMIKDFSLISDAGRDANIPMFTTNLILQQYKSAANTGFKDKDFFALLQWLAEMSGEITPKS